MIEKIRKLLIQHLSKKLLKMITVEDILTIEGKDWILGGRKLSADEIVQLQEEAQAFRKSLIVRLLFNEIKFQATVRMGDHAKVPADIDFGKAMLINLDTIQKFLARIVQKPKRVFRKGDR